MKIFGKRNNKKKQSTFCYCPDCNNELISSGSFVSDEELVKYKCSNCQGVSEWFFDAPAPILIRNNGRHFRTKE